MIKPALSLLRAYDYSRGNVCGWQWGGYIIRMDYLSYYCKTGRPAGTVKPAMRDHLS